MTLTLLRDRGDGSILLNSSAGQTVANSGATSTLDELMTGSIGDVDFWGARVVISSIATIETDAANLAGHVVMFVIDAAGSVLDLLCTMRLGKTGTDRVEGIFNVEGGRRFGAGIFMPWIPSTGGIRCIFRSPDTNATATGSFQLAVVCRRRRQDWPMVGPRSGSGLGPIMWPR